MTALMIIKKYCLDKKTFALLYKSQQVRFLCGLTSGLVDMHEDHFIIRCQDGVELLVTNRGQLGHVPHLTLVH